MNIIATDECPIRCAQSLDDRRLNAFVRETAQIFSTACFARHGIALPYKPTHEQHPVILWAANTEENLSWVGAYFIALSDEYTYRTGKVHKTTVDMFEPVLSHCFADPTEPEPFVNCAANESKGLSFKNIADTVVAYRRYINARWAIERQEGYTPVFTKRRPPAFSDFPKSGFEWR